MSTPFMGELRLMSFNFPPKNWALCNGQFLLISQNQALFSLMGTMYGGDGQTTFALPDLRGRTPVHAGGGLPQGLRLGTEVHTLTINELPAHTHQLQASSANGNQPTVGMLASANNLYGPATDPTALSPAAVTNVGGSQPHENRQPYTVLSWCISLTGIFPSMS